MENDNIKLANDLKKECLVIDIETYSPYDIASDFDNYVKHAKTKWIGFYSYKFDKYYEINVNDTPKDKIIKFINSHSTLITFNGINFDIPVLENNGLLPHNFFNQIDCQVILGSNVKKGHKNRGMLMGYKFKSNSLMNMAKSMKLETLKGDIDYKIFKKDEWTDSETIDIKKYLRADIEVTKLMFDNLFDFWLPFVNMININDVKKWSWLKTSVASLAYKSDCHELGNKEIYSDTKTTKQEMGGRVMLPKQDTANDVWYIDVTSLYPHIYIMFNLFQEVDVSDMTEQEKSKLWHGNDVFKVKGYYNINKHGQREKNILAKLKERIRLKKEDSNNPMVYALKILINSVYGISRSPTFTNIYTPNCGWDCCYIGQQINHIMEKKAIELGYKPLAADTDSVFIVHKNKKTKQEVEQDCKYIVDYILSNVPFPVDTFNIDIETNDKLDYVMWIKDSKTGLYKKKNYLYVYKKKGIKQVKIMGFPIKKSNATVLGMKIYKKYIEQRILKENTGKFDSDWISGLIKQEIMNDIELMAIDYKCSPYESYKSKGCMNAQISLNYLNGEFGVVKLIKNNKIGKIGKKFKYCTIEEAKKCGLTYKDLELTKVFNELAPFTNEVIKFTKTKRYF